MSTPLVVGCAVVILAAVITAFAMTPKERARRAALRKHRREMAELRSRVGASARATHRKQFPAKGRTRRSSDSGDSGSYYGSDGGGFFGGGDSGGGDGGGGGGD